MTQNSTQSSPVPAASAPLAHLGNDSANPASVNVDPALNQPGWWTDAVVYQIYPRSFADSNGDGIGDLRGIIDKVEYLAGLGVKVVWLSPIYTSPQDDNGYDIADYQNVDPMFGTLADLDELIAALHARGIRLVMDLVVNHTSDEHAWFTESASSTTAAKRDWYWWRDARPVEGLKPGEPGTEPNNWESAFSGPAWQWDEQTQQFYLHIFSSKQPDLNWENPQVRRAVYEMMRWWLERGIDGFRMDVINLISKDVDLPDGPPTHGRFGSFFPSVGNGPRFHEFLNEMHREVFEAYTDRVFLTVGETPGIDQQTARLASSPARREVDMVFQFEHVDLDREADKFKPRPLALSTLAQNLASWQQGLADEGWNSLYFENHDQPRSVSRWGDDDPEWITRSATALLGILHAHRGTPFLYQGQELGIPNSPWERLDQFRDLETLNYVRDRVAEGMSFDQMLAAITHAARDHARTPMQWTADTTTAGFTTGTPWIGVNPATASVNAQAQVGVPGSVHSFTRDLIALRQHEPLLVAGDFRLLSPDGEHPQVWAIRRTHESRTLTAMANFSRQSITVPAEWMPDGSSVALNNQPEYAPGRLAGWQLLYLVH